MRRSRLARGCCFGASAVSDVMTPEPETRWKSIAIALAILFGAVLIAFVLVVSGIMDLGFSLL
jgi:hypothetical protein